MSETRFTSFAHALHADGPAPDRAGPLQLYGRFVGDWSAEIIAHGLDGTRHRGTGEIHFGWVLQGRAVQDVWLIPEPGLPLAGAWFGTTIRVWNPDLDAWRIFWIDPATNRYRQQVGRAQGADIVQEGRVDDGSLSRWRFTRITPDSFHWLGEASTDEGASWRLQVEVIARRIAPAP